MAPRSQPTEPFPIFVLPQRKTRLAIERVAERICLATALGTIFAPLPLNNMSGHHFNIMEIMANATATRVSLQIPQFFDEALHGLLEGIFRITAPSGDLFDFWLGAVDELAQQVLRLCFIRRMDKSLQNRLYLWIGFRFILLYRYLLIHRPTIARSDPLTGLTRSCSVVR